ncbi:MFS transporter [Rubrobacter naiadicus]|uniref:MFS transporter n=1 Tax=Rubrobacter naiadicus TaxID=1392641 RepID=UPI002362C4F3|nr:MFS transporter [Rubrobacter naiadicus]
MANTNSLNQVSQASKRQVFTAGFASIIAWSFDLFDLFILLFVASTVGPLLFPSEVGALSLAAVYASFAVSLIMRPLGSVIFGHYADKKGRKRAMVIAIFGVGIATALMGAVPTVDQAGLVGPIAFVILRIIQGIFVGGVVASTHTIGTETISQKWRGFLSGAIGGGGAGVGALIASFFFFLTSSIFPGKEFSVWGWRVMFFTGIIGSILSLFVFKSVEESPLWSMQARTREVERSPLRTLFSRRYAPLFFINLLIVIGGGAHYYLTSGFLPTFLDVVNHISSSMRGRVLVVASLAALVSPPLFGHLSEIFGRKKIFIATGVINLFVIPYLYFQLEGLTSSSVGAIYLYTFILSFFGNAAYAPVLVFLNERFPTSIRSSGTGISWNTGFAIGGILPTFVTLASVPLKSLTTSVVVFLVAAILLYLVGALVNPETRGKMEEELDPYQQAR